jgi:hypothetical protein
VCNNLRLLVAALLYCGLRCRDCRGGAVRADSVGSGVRMLHRGERFCVGLGCCSSRVSNSVFVLGSCSSRTTRSGSARPSAVSWRVAARPAMRTCQRHSLLFTVEYENCESAPRLTVWWAC